MPLSVTLDLVNKQAKILLTGSDMSLNFEFELADHEVAHIIPFKGLLHCRPVKNLFQEIALDMAGIIKLRYDDGTIELRITHGSSCLTVPVSSEMYPQLNRLLDYWFE